MNPRILPLICVFVVSLLGAGCSPTEEEPPSAPTISIERLTYSAGGDLYISARLAGYEESDTRYPECLNLHLFVDQNRDWNGMEPWDNYFDRYWFVVRGGAGRERPIENSLCRVGNGPIYEIFLEDALNSVEDWTEAGKCSIATFVVHANDLRIAETEQDIPCQPLPASAFDTGLDDASTEPLPIEPTPTTVPSEGRPTDDLPKNLASCFPFDGSAVNLLGPPEGILRGNAGFVTDSKLGSHALDLNGSGLSDWVEVPETPLTKPPYTYSVWIKPRAAEESRPQLVVSSWYDYSHDAFRIMVVVNTIFFGIEPGWATRDWGAQSQTPIGNNQWYHLVVVRTIDALTLYINGELDTKITGLTEEIQASPDSWGIGRYPAEPPGEPVSYNGLVDDLVIWTRALNDAEIRALYNHGNGVSCTLTSWEN